MSYSDRLAFSRATEAPQRSGHWPDGLACPWCASEIEEDSFEPWGVAAINRVFTCHDCGRECTPIVTRHSITLEGLRTRADIAYLQAVGKLPSAPEKREP